jgi:hypothetical protein
VRPGPQAGRASCALGTVSHGCAGRAGPRGLGRQGRARQFALQPRNEDPYGPSPAPPPRASDRNGEFQRRIPLAAFCTRALLSAPIARLRVGFPARHEVPRSRTLRGRRRGSWCGTRAFDGPAGTQPDGPWPRIEDRCLGADPPALRNGASQRPATRSRSLASSTYQRSRPSCSTRTSPASSSTRRCRVVVGQLHAKRRAMSPARTRLPRAFSTPRMCRREACASAANTRSSSSSSASASRSRLTARGARRAGTPCSGARRAARTAYPSAPRSRARRDEYAPSGRPLGSSR